MRYFPLRTRLLALCLLAAGPADAGFDVTDVPPFPSLTRPRFQVNSANYLGAEGPEVVLAFRIPYAELFFSEGVDAAGAQFWEAEFDLVMVLSDGSRQVGGDLWNETVRVDAEAETESQRRWHRRLVRLPAEPGRLTAEVRILERDSGRSSVSTWEIQVPDYAKERVSLSSLWVVDGSRAEEEAQVPPRGWLLDSRFGEPLGAIEVRGEVYRANPNGDVALTWRILDARREVLVEHDLTLGEGSRLPFTVEPKLDALWLGAYVFEVEVEADGKRAVRRFEFQMDETMVSLANDMEQSLELVRLIATKQELEALEDALPTDRSAAWAKFWEERDPTPGTAENEFKQSFFERVRYANENYGVMEAGWRSDRGRIYIKYGTPDEVESRPSRLDGLAVEVWSYLDLGLRFVFVDYDGFGRYELYQPGRS